MRRTRATIRRERRQALAKGLAQRGFTTAEIAARLKVSRPTVFYLLNSERYELQRYRRNRKKPAGALHMHRRERRVSDHEVQARLAEIPRDGRSVTGVILGDPLPGRSALDRRHETGGERP